MSGLCGVPSERIDVMMIYHPRPLAWAGMHSPFGAKSGQPIPLLTAYGLTRLASNDSSRLNIEKCEM